MMTAAGVERARNSRRDSSLYSAQAWQSGLLMLIFISGGLRPAGPPYTLARGAPCAPLRSRGSLAVARSRRSVPRLDAHLYLRAASPPRTPLHTPALGPLCPPPLPWLPRSRPFTSLSTTSRSSSL